MPPPPLFFFIPDSVTEVKTDIYVTSFGPVSDTDMVSAAGWLPHGAWMVCPIRC